MDGTYGSADWAAQWARIMDTSYLCVGRRLDLANNWCALTSVARPEMRNRLHDADKLLSMNTKKSHNIVRSVLSDRKNCTGQWKKGLLH